MAAGRPGRGRRTAAAVVAASLSAALPAAGQDASLNLYGAPGVIDMPSGRSAPDAQLSTSIGYFSGIGRLTLSFQLSDRISGSFRYSRFGNLNYAGFQDYFDRSFDIRFKVLREGRYHPSVTVGLQDFIGTGVSSAEYVAATKTFASGRLAVTAGLGWGRLGTYGDLGTPFGERPTEGEETGGTPNLGAWFRGPVAPFAGIEYQLTDRITLKAEYSSDAYRLEAGSRDLFERKSPFNVGVEYGIGQSVRLGAYYLYGDTLGIAAHFALDPKTPVVPQRLQPPPLPVQPRSVVALGWPQTWADDPAAPEQARLRAEVALTEIGLVLESVRLDRGRAVVHLRNPRLDAEPQALGRTARALANTLPPEVETFVIVPVVNGMPVSAVTLRRSDVEALVDAPDGGAAILARATIADGAAYPLRDPAPQTYPRFSWSVSPAVSYSVFDPAQPFLFDVAVRGQAKYELRPGLVLEGAVLQRLWDNFGESRRPSNSVLPHVRSDTIRYLQEGETAIDFLTAAYYFRPGSNLYARVSAGYLERQFAGVSAELLWKPVDSRLALGAEANYVVQRDFDGGFGLRDYDVATGHVSAYYQFPQGYQAAVHAGRYLAGDWGATVELNREFGNGWRVGAFATLTDVSFEDFGEGSFDKGIQLTIPISYLTGKPTRAVAPLTLRPLTRDGGQRLNLNSRLYGQVRDYHSRSLSQEWGTFWR